jgi:hypothetical protein
MVKSFTVGSSRVRVVSPSYPNRGAMRRSKRDPC